MLVFDSLLISLSSLLLEFDLHGPFGMFHNGSLDLDFGRGYRWAAAECVLPRPKFVDFVELEDVADLHVFEVGHSEDVPGCKDVFFAHEGGYDVL